MCTLLLSLLLLFYSYYFYFYCYYSNCCSVVFFLFILFLCYFVIIFLIYIPVFHSELKTELLYKFTFFNTLLHPIRLLLWTTKLLFLLDFLCSLAAM